MYLSRSGEGFSEEVEKKVKATQKKKLKRTDMSQEERAQETKRNKEKQSRNPSSSPPSGLSFGLTMMRKRSEESEDLIPVPLPIGIRCSELVRLRS